MQFFVTFLEGMITFISPCVLPMIPMYLLYFAGDQQEYGKDRTLANSLAFVAGFTAVFLLLGVFSGALGNILNAHASFVNIVLGTAVTVFGMHYAGMIRIGMLNRTFRPGGKIRPHGGISAFVFGVVFAAGWSPCTGAFLGSALLMAAANGGRLTGMALLLCYSAGLGIPFVLSALLIDRFKTAFDFIKEHYAFINRICGVFLMLIGIFMMTGVFYRLTTYI